MLHIIIPTFNRIEFTIACLDSLKRQSFQEFEIVIVDDGSTDGTYEILSKNYPEVKILKGDGNLWWTASVNMGIEYAITNGADLILTLNNDTIAPPDYLENHIKWHKNNPVALLGSYAINKETGLPEYGGEIIDWKFARSLNLLKALNEKDRSGLHKVSHFPGRGLLIPVYVFEKIGLFDNKDFPHYYADYEFTHRAIRSGFKIYCNFDAKLLTYPNESGAEKIRSQKSFNGYINHLFGIKGGGNLKNFFKFGIRYCPPVFLAPYLFFGTIKRTFGYFIK